VASTQHHAWIHYRPNIDGTAGIGGWYCKCKVGARVVGCCAHVCSILWYLGYGRHLPNIRFPAANVGRNLLDARQRDASPANTDDDVDDREEDV